MMIEVLRRMWNNAVQFIIRMFLIILRFLSRVWSSRPYSDQSRSDTNDNYNVRNNMTSQHYWEIAQKVTTRVKMYYTFLVMSINDRRIINLVVEVVGHILAALQWLGYLKY